MAFETIYILYVYIYCFKCHRKVCDACQKFLLPYKRIISVATGKSYKIRQHLSCRTDFVIYCAFCKKCNRQCVGSAIDFRRRLFNYKSHIKKNKNAHVDLLSILLMIVVTTPQIVLNSLLQSKFSTKQRKIWRNENATGKHNSGPLSLLVLMPKENLIQAGVISSCVNLFISRSWSLNRPYYLWSHQQILTLVLRVLLILDC